MKSAVTNGQALCLKYNLKEAWKVYYLNLFLYCLTEESLFTHSPLSRKMIGRIVEWQISLSIASVRSRQTESLQLTFRDNATAQAPLFLKWFQLRSKWSILSFAASEKKKKKTGIHAEFLRPVKSLYHNLKFQMDSFMVYWLNPLPFSHFWNLVTSNFTRTN